MESIKRWVSIIIGCIAVSLGINLLTSSHLVMGGTAGLGMVLHPLTGLSFGILFFIINLPFYFMAITQIGVLFTIRSFVSVTLLSFLSDYFSEWLPISLPHPLLSSPLAGIIIGIGLIFLFRNGSSLGGINMLCVYLDKKYGINPGKTMFTTDLMILCGAIFVFGIVHVLYSFIAIFMMSAVLGRYHKRSPIEKNHVSEQEEDFSPLSENSL